MPALQASFLYEYVCSLDQALKLLILKEKKGTRKDFKKVTFSCPLN